MVLPLLVSLVGSTLTSGVVGLKTNDPQVIERAVKFFLESEPDHCVEIVRVAKGEGVLLAFSACVTPSGRPTEMGAFTSLDTFSRLAKALAQPVWGGYVVKGASRQQRAYAVDATGKERWTSDHSFAQSAEQRREERDPFVDPIELRARWARSRNSAGYGRLAGELGFDYWLVLNLETGEADLTTKARRIVKGDVRAHLKWLQAPWSPPEGPDSDPPPVPLPAGVSTLLVCQGCGAEAAATIAAVAGELAKHRSLPAPQVLVRSGDAAKQLALRLGAQSEGPLWPTMRSRNFLTLLVQLLPADASVELYEREADLVSLVMSAKGNSVFDPRARRGDGIPDKAVLRLYGGVWKPLSATTELAGRVAKAREALMDEAW
jgi:hypothetical protein